MKFSVIAAIDKNRGLGKDGKLAWNLLGDLKHFKAVTCKVSKPGAMNAVIMGRTTWESLPEKYRPLPNRINIVLTRKRDFKVPDGVILASAIDETLDILSTLGNGVDQFFVIGGASVYAQAVIHPACNKVYLTEIDKVYDCDTYFPSLPNGFIKQDESDVVTENNINYKYVIYERI
ncbi:MAG: dihydrofolate reductase [Patescibacteria group bacterium]